MSGISGQSGLMMVWNPDGSAALPITTTRFDSAILDPLFVVGDATWDRIDDIVVHILSWELGSWEFAVVHGETSPMQSELDTVTVTGSPTGGAYTFTDYAITVNVGDNEATIQAAMDAYFGGGGSVVTGEWDLWTIDFGGGPYANQSIDLSSGSGGIDATGLTGGTLPAVQYVRTLVGGDGTPVEPVIDGTKFRLSVVLVPAGATSWDDCTFTDVRPIATPAGFYTPPEDTALVQINSVSSPNVVQGAGSLVTSTSTIQGILVIDQQADSNFGNGIISVAGHVVFDTGTLGDTSSIVLDFGNSLPATAALLVAPGGDFAVVGNVYGIIGGAPFVGLLGSNGTGVVIMDATAAHVETPLDVGDVLTYAFTTGFAVD